MDKMSLVSRYSENDEEKAILSHMLDLAQRSYTRSTVECGNFVSEALRLRAEKMLEAYGVSNFFFWGGYENADRTCPVFFTDYCTHDQIISDSTLAQITFIQAETDRFNTDAQISHRDVLGSLMGLGIERDCIGDINAEQGNVLIAVKTPISPFIIQNLSKIGRYPVKVTCAVDAIMEKKEDFEECFDTVASLRLDAVTATLFSTSRSIAGDAIEAGLVSVNGACIKKTDSSVREGDKIAFRTRGKAVVEKLDGLSRKGRMRMVFKRYK